MAHLHIIILCNMICLVKIRVALGFVFLKHSLKSGLGNLVSKQNKIPGNFDFQKYIRLHFYKGNKLLMHIALYIASLFHTFHRVNLFDISIAYFSRLSINNKC